MSRFSELFNPAPQETPKEEVKETPKVVEISTAKSKKTKKK